MPSQFDIPLDESVQILKQVLPMMSQQRVPTIPENYAVWFDYVSNRNDKLTEELQAQIEQGAEFTPARCRNLYERFYQEELVQEVDGIQGAVRVAVESVLQEVGSLGDDISSFSDVLDSAGVALDGNPTQEDLNKLVVELVRETTKTRARTQEVESSLQGMNDELTEMRSQISQLSRDSLTDALTGVANRRAFDETMAKLTEEAAADGSPLCLILSDIDHFKKFNDTHGHLVGDEVLRFVAQEMEQCVKGRDLLARYGGEEFAVLLPNTPVSGGSMLAESIRTLIEAQSIESANTDEELKVTLSLGVALYRPGEDISAFIERADECLYKCKADGRNRVTSEDALG